MPIAAATTAGHHACTSPLFAQQPKPSSLELPELQKCWAVLGVLSKLVDVQARAFIRTSAARSVHSICSRFVVGDVLERNLSAAERSTVDRERAASDLVLFRGMRDDDCGRKTFVWFRHALRAFPTAAWIGKADTDTFVQLRALEADLLSLSADVSADAASGANNVIVGQFSWAASWSFDQPPLVDADHESRIHAGRPCGQVVQMQDVVPRWSNVSRNVRSLQESD